MKPTHFIRFATIVKFLTKYEYGLGPGSLGIVRITELRMLNMMLVLYFTMRQEEGRLRDPRVSLTVLESEMGEWRFVETFG